jgi:hypothetical protein
VVLFRRAPYWRIRASQDFAIESFLGSATLTHQEASGFVRPLIVDIVLGATWDNDVGTWDGGTVVTWDADTGGSQDATVSTLPQAVAVGSIGVLTAGADSGTPDAPTNLRFE